MKKETIKRHMGTYSIHGKRRTTINHAFASAIAPFDKYDEKKVAGALRLLEQDPEKDLMCVYCAELAETWDHLHGLVRESVASGFGHTVGNLVPCCQKCNSKKGSKDWKDFVKNNPRAERLLMKFTRRYSKSSNYSLRLKKLCPKELGRLEMIKKHILKKMIEADEVATAIKKKLHQ